MKPASFALACLLFTHMLCAAMPDPSPFIRQEGIYQLAPDVKLTIDTDSKGVLRFAFSRIYKGDGIISSQATNSDSLDTPHGGPILAYWDTATQTFWIASAKHVTCCDQRGTTLYEGPDEKSLKTAPAVFRAEAERVFKTGGDAW